MNRVLQACVDVVSLRSVNAPSQEESVSAFDEMLTAFAQEPERRDVSELAFSARHLDVLTVCTHIRLPKNYIGLLELSELSRPTYADAAAQLVILASRSKRTAASTDFKEA